MRKELWPGGPTYAGDSVQTDSLALADFAGGIRAHRGCDLGCGSGILMLLLLWAQPGLSMVGVDIRQTAVEACRRNMAANGLAERSRAEHADLREELFPAESMDLVVSNPPYFRAGSGGISPDPERAVMRTESASLSELCAAAARLLSPDGAFCLVHRTERCAEVLETLRRSGLEPQRLRYIAGSIDAAPSLFLCEARKGGASALTVLPPLFQRDKTGQETPEYRKITHWEA